MSEIEKVLNEITSFEQFEDMFFKHKKLSQIDSYDDLKCVFVFFKSHYGTSGIHKNAYNALLNCVKKVPSEFEDEEFIDEVKFYKLLGIGYPRNERLVAFRKLITNEYYLDDLGKRRKFLKKDCIAFVMNSYHGNENIGSASSITSVPQFYSRTEIESDVSLIGKKIDWSLYESLPYYLFDVIGGKDKREKKMYTLKEIKLLQEMRNNPTSKY